MINLSATETRDAVLKLSVGNPAFTVNEQLLVVAKGLPGQQKSRGGGGGGGGGGGRGGGRGGGGGGKVGGKRKH